MGGRLYVVGGQGGEDFLNGVESLSRIVLAYLHSTDVWYWSCAATRILVAALVLRRGMGVPGC
eukprot:1894307-Rhodomonas_salina.1